MYKCQWSLIKTMTLNAGSGQTRLETSTLAAGIYNLTLSVRGRQVDAKRMVITK
jgi:hypothetical protein